MLRLIVAAALSCAVFFSPAGAVTLAGVEYHLAARVRQIQVACPGTVIVSTLRQTRRPGGSWSKHASGNAVDVRGNYACI